MTDLKNHTNVTAGLRRADRRMLLERERRLRKIGVWGAWEEVTFPAGSAGPGWAADFTAAHKNRVFSVLDRRLPDGVRHLAIASLSGERPTWWEAMRIKNEIAGEHATAVEVYPPAPEVVDGADMYHLWVLPSPLPFSLHPASSALSRAESTHV